MIPKIGQRKSKGVRLIGSPDVSGEVCMDERIQNAIDFMNVHLDRKVSLAELAHSVAISPSHLCYLFKLQTAMPPHQYFLRLKMRKAEELLRTTSLSIKQIMIEVGFINESLFVRNFKRTYGLAPSHYRAHSAHPEYR